MSNHEYANSNPFRPKPMQPTVVNHGLFIEHDMPCAVCLRGHAVYAMQIGVFAPCWDCQEDGWDLVNKTRKWWQFWRKKKR